MQYLIYYCSFFFLGQMLFAPMLFAQAPMPPVIMPNDEQYVGKSLHYWTDSSGTATVADARQKAAEGRFQEGKAEVLNLGFTDKPIWLHAVVVLPDTLSSPNQHTLVHYFPNAYLLEAYWILPNGLVVKQQSGKSIEWAEKPIKSRFHGFPAPLVGRRETVQVFIRYKAVVQALVPMKLTTTNALHATDSRSTLVVWLCAGIMIGLLLYNAILGANLRDSIYWLFTLVDLTKLGIVISISSGVIFGEFFSEYRMLTFPASSIFSAIYIIVIALFSYQYLDIPKNFPKIHHLRWWFLGAGLICLLLPFFQNKPLVQRLLYQVAIIEIIGLIILAFVLYRRGYKPALYFLLASGVGFCFTLNFVIVTLGVLSWNLVSFHGFYVGFAIEVVLYSLALSVRIKTIQQESEARRIKALEGEIYRQHNAQLTKANQELSEANNEIERQMLLVDEQAREIELANAELQEKNADVEQAKMEIERQMAILDEQSREIELKNSELQETNTKLDHLVQTLKHTQAQLIQQERMSAMGMLTAGMAHEINNPNAIALGASEQAIRKLQELHEYFLSLLDDNGEESVEAETFQALKQSLENYLGLVSDGTGRIRDIVQNLQGFTRHQELGMREDDLGAAIQSTIKLFAFRFADVKVSYTPCENMAMQGNFGELNQVFLNLLLNAAQAGAKNITLHVKRESVSHQLSVHITDDGQGMDAATQQRIFEPFFSTKGVGNSGLGLSIIKQILERHHAAIGVSSAPNRGTTFHITFLFSSAKPA